MWSHSFRPQFSRVATFFFKHHFTFSFVISLDFNRAVAAKYEALTQFRITRKSAIRLCHRFLSDKTLQEKKHLLAQMATVRMGWGISTVIGILRNDVKRCLMVVNSLFNCLVLKTVATIHWIVNYSGWQIWTTKLILLLLMVNYGGWSQCYWWWYNTFDNMDHTNLPPTTVSTVDCCCCCCWAHCIA